MRCDSQVFLLAHTFASLCLGRKPKARVATTKVTIIKAKLPNSFAKKETKTKRQWLWLHL
jgi:hypothetical protein